MWLSLEYEGLNYKVFWEIPPYRLVKVNSCFGGACCVHVQGSPSSLLGLPGRWWQQAPQERNSFSVDTASCPRKPESSWIPLWELHITHFKTLSPVGSYLTTYDFVQPMEYCDSEGKVASFWCLNRMAVFVEVCWLTFCVVSNSYG